jgi:hypothetical protein
MKKYLLILIGLSFFFALPAYAMPTQIEVATTTLANANNGNSTSTFHTPTTSGELVLVFVADAGSNSSTVTDNLNDTYVNEYTTRITGSQFMELWYLANAPSGITSVNVKETTAHLGAVTATHWTGIATSPLDTASSPTGPSSTPWASSPITTSQATELIVGDVYGIYNGVNCAVVPSGSWTNGYTFNPASGWDGANGGGTMYSYQVVSTIQTNVQDTGTDSGTCNHYAGIVGFEAAPAVPVINSFTATPSSFLCFGGSVKLSWNVTGDSSDTISGVGSVATGTASTSISLSATQTFTLTSQNALGTSTASLTVPVYTCGVIAQNVVADRCIFL